VAVCPAVTATVVEPPLAASKVKSVTVKVTTFEVPPPGAGLVTTTLIVFGEAISEAGTAAVI
jgi:hypothetical protein